MVRTLLPVLSIVAALATFAFGYTFLEGKNRISFPEQDIEVQCPLSTPRFDRVARGFDLASLYPIPSIMETGCGIAAQLGSGDDAFEYEFTTSDHVYGYEKASGQLLYVATKDQNGGSNIAYYRKPSDFRTPDPNIVQKCGFRTIAIEGRHFSSTYNFPCTDEVGVVPVPENGNVNLTGFLTSDDRYRYQVSCGAECSRTVEMVEHGSWRVVTP